MQRTTDLQFILPGFRVKGLGFQPPIDAYGIHPDGELCCCQPVPLPLRHQIGSNCHVSLVLEAIHAHAGLYPGVLAGSKRLLQQLGSLGVSLKEQSVKGAGL